MYRPSAAAAACRHFQALRTGYLQEAKLRSQLTSTLSCLIRLPLSCETLLSRCSSSPVPSGMEPWNCHYKELAWDNCLASAMSQQRGEKILVNLSQRFLRNICFAAERMQMPGRIDEGATVCLEKSCLFVSEAPSLCTKVLQIFCATTRGIKRNSWESATCSQLSN